MAVKTEANRLNDVLFWEGGPEARYAREKITLLSGQNLKVGAVLGRRLVSPTVGAAVALGSNTGDGAVSGEAVGTNLGAQRGVYRIVFVEPTTNLGTFQVFDPHGVYVGDGVVATEFDNQIKFTIADGSADFVAGDAFTITVGGGTYKFKEYSPANADGSQRVAGVLGADTDASAADVATWAIVRDAIVKDSGLVWFSGATADQKTQGKTELAALGIATRTDA